MAFQPITRADGMEQFILADIDFHEGDVRVLYQSLPSLEQATRPGWSVNVYVALLGSDGAVENRLLATGQRHYASLLLRRGADEVYFLPRREGPGHDAVVERRTITDGSLLGTFSHPWIVRAAGESQTVYPVADGSIFLTAQSPAGDPGSEIAWRQLSPSGDVLAEGGLVRRSANAMLAGIFPVAPGRLGMTVHLSVAGDAPLETDIPAPVVVEVGGRKLEAWPFSEMRAFVTDPDGEVDWVSTAIERDFMWQGEMSIPKSLPVEAMMAQNARQMELMEHTALTYAGQRQVTHQSRRGFDEIKPAPGGWGMLVKQTANRDLQPPLHGLWYFLLGRDGTIQRRTRLEGQTERLNARFERFLPSPDGGLVVAGRSERGKKFHVTALNEAGEASWSMSFENPRAQFDDIVGEVSAPWLVGHGWSDASAGTVLWVRQVDRSVPSAANPSPASGSSVGDTDALDPASVVPDLDPINGCSCQCDELRRFQAEMGAVKNLPPTEQMALMRDPGFTARMGCMAKCAMQYASCNG